jgi:glycosyltransferase involved in cell wall biosynthesis
MLEALATGLPVVTSAVGGARDLSSPAVHQVRSGDILAFTTAIGRLLENPCLRSRASQAAIEITHRLYALDRWIADHCELYCELGLR